MRERREDVRRDELLLRAELLLRRDEPPRRRELERREEAIARGYRDAGKNSGTSAPAQVYRSR